MCTCLLPWWWVPSSCHTVPRMSWTGPSVAGFFQVQVWLLNVAAPSLWESYQLSLQGLLAALHVPLPHTQATGCGTLGAKKGGMSVQSRCVPAWGCTICMEFEGWDDGRSTTRKDPTTVEPGPSRYRWDTQRHRAHQHHKTEWDAVCPCGCEGAKSGSSWGGGARDQGSVGRLFGCPGAPEP